jgi:hypothetical protein
MATPRTTTRILSLLCATLAVAEVAAAPAGEHLAQGPPTQLFIYPRQGQSPQQQNNDRYECHYWAVNQTGYDPNFASGNEPAEKIIDYQRAISACLEARGYTVR